MNLIEKLKGGDLRSIGKSNEVVSLVGNDQQMFDEVFSGIFDKDPLVSMRCADVAEKASAKHRKLLISNKDEMLDNLHDFTQQEVKWHMALMFHILT